MTGRWIEPIEPPGDRASMTRAETPAFWSAASENPRVFRGDQRSTARGLLAALLLLAPLTASAQPNKPIVPEKGEPFVYLHDPTLWVPVWWDEQFEKHKDGAGRPIVKALRCYLFTIGSVADVGFYRDGKDAYGKATLRFHYGDQATVCAKSRAWKHHPNNLCSTYFACDPNRRDFWLGVLNKPSSLASANQPMWQQTFVRVTGHALCTVGLDWFPEQSLGAPLNAYRNPYMSQSIKPVAYDDRGRLIVSGHDEAEIGAWRAWSRSIWPACKPGGWLVQTGVIAN